MLRPTDEPWPCAPKRTAVGAVDARLTSVANGRSWLPPWAREQTPGPTDEERELLGELDREHRIPGASETDPLPMIGLAQLYRRDVPDLPTGPGDGDLLQVFWCPFDAHGPGRYDLELHLRWRRSWEVGDVLTAPPQPLVVGSLNRCRALPGSFPHEAGSSGSGRSRLDPEAAA
ncbi:hypothetical protein ABZY81_40535 [Streptomyces sp. NPDC006514]|uniref:hypothetical protein n=1 Tax=Streptomyces sp. NPDC006514 TaxID=3154308 RepID=UPI0033A42339